MKPLLHRALFPVGLLLATIFSSVAAVTVGDLRCEHLENPQGIDAAQPRLSWMLQSNERNVKQSAYQILVASSAAKLKSDQGDLWDSGKISSDDSVLVPYAGKPLASRSEYFWKVRVWDTDGKPGKWSQPAKWTMGILDPGEWHAQWIGQDGIDLTNEFTGTSWIWYPEGEPQAAGVVIGIETSLSAAVEVKLLDDIGSPAIKSYFNFANAIQNGRDLTSELRALGKDRLCQIHCTDGDEAWLQNDPKINLPKIKQTLDEMGWSGWLVIERSRDPKDPRNVKWNFSANAAYLKSVFQPK